MYQKALRVIEEASELSFSICKAERFGWFNHYPGKPGRTNAEDVLKEMGNLLEAMEKLRQEIMMMTDREIQSLRGDH